MVVEGNDLRVYFPVRTGWPKQGRPSLRAVDGVDIEVRQGETLGVVGESGCGKSTLARLLTQLLAPTAGTLRFNGRDVTRIERAEARRLRRETQLIFQDPAGSLNPRRTVGQIVRAGLDIHRVGSKVERRAAVRDALTSVGLPSDAAARYPQELSGGQRQRVGIARALVLRPRFVVADEPISALDVSIQAQILNLMMDLKQDFGLTYVFIAHDLAAVAYVSDRIAVMYLGQIVELGPARDVAERPQHPYTVALLSSVLTTNQTKGTRRVVLKGDVPSPMSPPSGCRFRTRCPLARQICTDVAPSLVQRDDPQSDHLTACHFASEMQ